MDTPCLSPRPQAPLCRRPADPHLLRLEASGGEASETHYPVFPGMELIYRDIHAHTCRENRGGTGERLEIHHCLEGRIEYRQSGRYFYLAPGDLVVARSSSLPQGSRFPTGHYHGIAVVIDPAAAPECLSCILSDVEVRPAALMEKLCPGGAVFAARSSPPGEPCVLRAVRRTGGQPQGLPKGKAVRAAAVSQHPLPRRCPPAPHGCTAAQVTLAGQVRTCLLSEPDQTMTLQALSRRFGVSAAQIKSALPGSTECPPPPTSGRSGCTARRSCCGRRTAQCWILRVSLGDDNASKFAKAFRDVIGVSPREYRSGAEYDSCAPRLHNADAG